jgi:hypothetical protein
MMGFINGEKENKSKPEACSCGYLRIQAPSQQQPEIGDQVD